MLIHKILLGPIEDEKPSLLVTCDFYNFLAWLGLLIHFVGKIRLHRSVQDEGIPECGYSACVDAVGVHVHEPCINM